MHLFERYQVGKKEREREKEGGREGGRREGRENSIYLKVTIFSGYLI